MQQRKMLNEPQKKILLKLARDTISAHLKYEESITRQHHQSQTGGMLALRARSARSDPAFSLVENADFEASDAVKKEFAEKKGAFVTLTIGGELRGCIGFIEAIFPLWECVTKAAEAAAFSDPRFTPLKKDEFSDVMIGISVLDKPVIMKGDYTKQIKIGRDGLIVSMEGFHGLLLPQVAVEWEWNVKEFLENTCVKAGLDKDMWKMPECEVYRFGAEVFGESL